MLTRQQQCALLKQKLKEKPEKPIRRSVALWALKRSQLLLELSKRLVSPLKQLPWWADILGVLVALIFLYEFFYDTVPSIQPDPVISPSWHDLPLMAKIESRIFSAHVSGLVCEVENITWDTKGKLVNGWTNFRFKGKLEINVEKYQSIIPPHGAISFMCNVYDKARFTIAPSIAPNGEHADISLIKLRVRMDYSSSFGLLRRETTSPQFTWRAVSGGYQWLEGDASDVP
jgi:hypothetical protein